jgi:UDP:flavonoid glycosyltransferase YjiC (YdhE family)
VTNGGYGTVQRALAHGVPLVVAGQTEDKPEVCARVAWSGAGIDLRTSHPKPRQIAEAVTAVLSTAGYRAAAGRIAADFAAHDAPATVSDLLERLLTTRRAVCSAAVR